MPNHIAFIMDGNRRYATTLNLPRIEGHANGYAKLTQALTWCAELGIRCVTVYAFSIDNFKRTEEEVADLLAMAEKKFAELLEEKTFIDQHCVHIRAVGDLDRLPHSLRAVMCAVEDYSAQYAGQLTLNVCFSYTSTDEMASAAARVADGVALGELDVDTLDTRTFASALGIENDVDIIVRTSGEIRLSNFLLWQGAHAHLAFLPVLWPDLSFWDLVHVLLQYQADPRHQGEQSGGLVEGEGVDSFRARVEGERREYVATHAASMSPASS